MALGGVPAGIMKPQEAAMVAAIISTIGSIPEEIAIGASNGKIIVTVARLEVNSVKKLTMATTTNMIKTVLSAVNPVILSPIQVANPLDSKASASASPPPNNKIIPQGNFPASSQFNIPFSDLD